MDQAALNYTLAAAELGAVRALLTLQKVIGQDVVPSPRYDIVERLAASLDSVSVSYTSLANTTVKGWVDQLFTSLIATNTCYGRGFAELFVALRYGNYVHSIGDLSRYGPGGWNDIIQPSDGYNYYTCFSTGLNADRYLGPWRNWGTGSQKDWSPPYPQAPPQWVTAVNAVFTAWGTNPPATLIDKGNGAGYDTRVPAFEARVVSSGWTDFNKVQTNTVGVWKAQAQTATTMLAAEKLTADAYFFLLHLLVALAVGDTASQALAQRVTAAIASSLEYPNDTFLNQLVYLALMYLADPLGAFGWDNQQLQAFVSALAGAVLGQDPVSTAIKMSLETHGKLLHSASSYPMLDPYAPSVAFTQRKTDTLFALDKARQALKT